MSKKRLAILISGRGSNMLSLYQAVAQGKINGEVCLVLSNKEDSAGLSKARELDLVTRVVLKKKFNSRDGFDDALLQALNRSQPDLVVLAGFTHILGNELVNAYYGKMINIHPSLLPKYPGLDTHGQVIANGDKQHGLSIHYVSNELDAGPMIMQQTVDVLPDDDASSLATRLLVEEHKCLAQVVQLLAQDRIKLDATTDPNQVLFDNQPLPPQGIIAGNVL